MMDFEKLAKQAVEAGMKHVELGLPYDVRNIVELCVNAGVAHIVNAVKPEKVKVKVKKGAKASATVE